MKHQSPGSSARLSYLVDEAAIQVNCLDGNDGVTTLDVHVAPSDTGKLIGKQGRTARSSIEPGF
jgi:predicted RNA-binding protein YlqC (UPF0109 family)